jgi:HEPN domain-containing protein
MTPQVEEALRQLRLAERDRDVFEILAGSAGRTDNAHAATGFHAQQAVEKALKALLCLRDIDFPRTHDLESLINRLVGSGSVPDYTASHLRPLTPYAVDFRYDDEVVRLLTEDAMRAVVMDTLNFVAGELRVHRGKDS